MFLSFLSFFCLMTNAYASQPNECQKFETLQQKRERAGGYITDKPFVSLRQEEGIKLYHELIDQGDEYAAQELANHYEYGVILQPTADEERTRLALEALIKGAKNNQPNAMFSLARLNKKYDYTIFPVQEMMTYLVKGDELNHDNCRCFLSILYRDQDFCKKWGISYDIQQVVNILSRSIATKSEIGATHLGEVYLSGELGYKDFVAAYKILHPFLGSDSRIQLMWNNVKKEMPYPHFIDLVEHQFDKDDQQANYYIAKGYIKGRYGLPKNLELAEQYLLQGITKKDLVKSIYLLIKLYMDEKSFLYSKDKAVNLFFNELQKNRTYLAIQYRYKLDYEDAKYKLQNFNLAHDQRNFCANYQCGRDWAPRQYKPLPDTQVAIAKKYFEVAIEKKYVPAYCYLAEAYLFGYLGKIDQSIAENLLERASTKPNSYKAKVMLSNLEELKTEYFYQSYIQDPEKFKDRLPRLREMLMSYK